MVFYMIMWYKTIENSIGLWCLVLEISSFEFDDYRGCHAGAGVHKRFVDGVWTISTGNTTHSHPAASHQANTSDIQGPFY